MSDVSIIIEAVDHASGVFDKIGGAMGGLGNIAKGALTVGLGAATAGVGALTAGLGLSISEAMDAEKYQAQLAAVITSTGGAAGVTAEMANKLAEAIQNTTPIADDAVVAGESMLLTFTNIGANVFPGATQAMVDMATAMNSGATPSAEQLKQTAMQLGKALNDPEKGMTALQRVGVTFTDAQKDTVAAMIKVGDTAGAQQLILAELSKEFGGSATAAGKTFSGQMEMLKNQVLNVAEGVGTKLLPVLTDGLSAVTPYIMAFAKTFADFIGSEQFQQWLKDISEWLKTSLPVAIQFVTDAWNNVLLPAIKSIWDFGVNYLIPMLSLVVDWVKTYLPPALQTLSTFWTETLQPAMRAVWDWAQAYLIPFLQEMWSWMQEKLPPAIQELSEFWTNVLYPAIKAVVDFLAPSFENAFTQIGQIFNLFTLAFQGDWNGFGAELRRIWDLVWEDIKGLASRAWEWIKTIDWWAVGKTIIDGIIAGVTALGTNLWDILSGFFDWNGGGGVPGLPNVDNLGNIIPGYAAGGAFTVPSGYSNDTFPFRARLTSGERVSITPAGQSSGGDIAQAFRELQATIANQPAPATAWEIALALRDAMLMAGG